MPRRINAVGDEYGVCRWVNLREALHHFGTHAGSTQSQQHIKPLHWYIASRLVVEGGFMPEDITPRPPFRVSRRAGSTMLHYDPTNATGGERTILGGLKTKNVDVVVTKDGLGPVLAVSCKGMTGAFRNLTNRMEETIGECTNLHITYPAMVFGYMFVIRANRQVEERLSVAASDDGDPSPSLAANDVAIGSNGRPVETIQRFHNALRELTGRRGIRNDVSRYESVALAMVTSAGDEAGMVDDAFPSPDSPLRLADFFQTLYLRYEERFLIGAPDLKKTTRRQEWSSASPVFAPGQILQDDYPTLDYLPRVDGEVTRPA